MKLKRRFIGAACALALLLSAAGCADTSDDPGISPGAARPAGLNVSTEQVERRDLEFESNIAAYMMPLEHENLIFKDVSGVLLNMNAQPLQWVKAGDLLAELDPGDLEKSVEAAAIQSEVWELRKSQQSLSSTNSQLTLDMYALDVERAQKLYDEDPTPERKYNLDRLKLQQRSAQNAKQLETLAARQFNIEYDEFMKGFEELKQQRDNLKILAPEDGIVLSVSKIDVGENVVSGRVVMTFAGSDDFLLRLDVNDGYPLQSQDAITAVVNGTSYSMYHYTPVPGDEIWENNSSGVQSKVYLRFSGAAPGIDVYTTVAARFSVEKKGALSVSRRCIRNSGGLTTVDLLKDGVYVQTPVTCGITSGNLIEILSGLEEGDVVSNE